MQESRLDSAAIQNLNNQIWRSRIYISTKLYNTRILPIFLMALSAGQLPMEMYSRMLSDHWCLQKWLGIKWYHNVWNDEGRWTTKQPLVWAIVQAWHSYLFGHMTNRKMYINNVCRWSRCQEVINSLCFGELEETTGTPSHYVDEDCPVRPEIQ